MTSGERINCLCVNTALPLVDPTLPQLETPEVIHASSATITSEILLTTLHPLHMSESVFHTQNVEHQWKSRSCTSYTIGLKRGTLPELWPLHDILVDSEKEMARTYTGTRSINETSRLCAKHIGDYKAGNEDRLVQKFEETLV